MFIGHLNISCSLITDKLSFLKWLFKSLATFFFIELSGFSYLFVGVLHNLGLNPLLITCFASLLSLSCSAPSQSLNVSLMKKILTLIQFNLSIFSFMVIYFCVLFKKFLPTQGQEYCLPKNLVFYFKH